MDALTTLLKLPADFFEAFARGDVGIPLLVDQVSLFAGFRWNTYSVERDIEVRAGSGLWRVTIPDWKSPAFCARDGNVSLRVAHDGETDGLLQFPNAAWTTVNETLVITARERRAF